MTKQELKAEVETWKKLHIQAVEDGNKTAAEKALKLALQAWRKLQALELGE